MRFTDHYCGNSVCAPSRCSLLTGLHPGHAYIRANSPGYPNGQTPLPKNTETIAKNENGVWKLYGIKWFTSAIDSEMSLALAKPEGVDQLQLFLQF